MTREQIFISIQEAAFEVRRCLAPGYYENVYRNALEYELRLRGLKIASEVDIPVSYKGFPIGNFKADIIVENSIIIELKAVKEILSAHISQLINYLTATGYDYGYLINYGGDTFYCRQKTRLYTRH